MSDKKFCIVVATLSLIQIVAATLAINNIFAVVPATVVLGLTLARIAELE